VVAFDAGAVAETLDGAGVLLKQKQPAFVAELIGRLLGDAALHAAVLATQERSMARLRARDFGALLREGLAPVLGSAA
jgi:hypothetical protein